ncbi:MAG: hypothetical protein ABFD62_17435, partial [Syntrophaceae bacterium]
EMGKKTAPVAARIKLGKRGNKTAASGIDAWHTAGSSRAVQTIPPLGGLVLVITTGCHQYPGKTRISIS